DALPIYQRRYRVRDRAGIPRRARGSSCVPPLRLMPMVYRVAVRAVLPVVCAVRVGAQQPQAVMLQDAVALAQRQGYQARAATAARDAARYRARAFTARLLPQLSLSGIVPNYSRAIIPVVQPDGSTLFVPQHQTNASLNMTLSQKLPVIGGDLFVSSALARVTVAGQQSLETWSSTPVSDRKSTRLNSSHRT